MYAYCLQERSNEHLEPISVTFLLFDTSSSCSLCRPRLLNEPKPIVVAMAWVVACAEAKAHVDESEYLIDLTGENIAGVNKVCISRTYHRAATHVLAAAEIDDPQVHSRLRERGELYPTYRSFSSYRPGRSRPGRRGRYFDD